MPETSTTINSTVIGEVADSVADLGGDIRSIAEAIISGSDPAVQIENIALYGERVVLAAMRLRAEIANPTG